MGKNRLFLLIYPMGFLCLTVFTIYDLNISISLYNNQQVFSILFEFLGGLPSVIVGGVSCLILYKTAKFKKRSQTILHHLFILIVFGFTIIIGADLFRRYIDLGSMGFFVIGISLIIINVLLYKALKFDHREEMRKLAWFGLFYFLLVILSFNLLKISWGRERFSNMSYPYSNFTPWYLRQSFTRDNAFMSFPSGHAANASTIIWLSLFPKLKGKKWFKLFSLLWILSVMYSRIVLGAHYASDVTVGALLSLSIFLILNKHINKNKKKLSANNTSVDVR